MGNTISYEEFKKKNTKQQTLPQNTTPQTTGNTLSYQDFVVRNNAKKQLNNSWQSKVYNYLTQPKQVETAQDKRNTWFNTGAKGNILQKTAGTVGDIGLNVVKGIAGAGEKLGDLASYGVAGVADVLGAKDYAKNVRESAQINLVGNALQPVTNQVNQYSLTGDKLDSIVQSVGESYAMAQVGGALGKTKVAQKVGLGDALNKSVKLGKLNINIPLMSVLTGASSGITEAYQKGGDNQQAFIKGLTSGLAEGISEGIFGVFGQGGSSFEQEVMYKATKKIENELARRLTKLGITAAGEGAEEGISYAFNYVADNLQDIVNTSLGKEINKMGDKWNWNEFGENILSGAIAGGLSGGAELLGGGRGAAILESTQHQVENALNRALTDAEVATLAQETEKQLNNGKINIDQIVNRLQNPTVEDLVQQQGIKSDTTPQLDSGLQQQLQLPTQNFTVDTSGYSGTQLQTYQNAINSGLLNNNKNTHDFVDFVSRISKDKGIVFNFTNNQALQDRNINAQINGFIDNNGITLNVDSNMALEKVIGHEITHTLEDMVNEYNSLKNSFKQLLGEEYNTRLEQIKELYSGIEGANYENELISDLAGEYLFTNEEFINRLSTEKPSLFRRIYEEIKYLWKMATGTEQEKQLARTMRIYEQAYRNAGKVSNYNVDSFAQNTQNAQETQTTPQETKPEIKKYPNLTEEEVKEYEFLGKWGNGTPLTEKGYPDWVEGIDLQEFIETEHPEFDGFIVDEGAEGGYGQPVIDRGISYVVMNPNQVKNVDNLNPTTNPDIRYSLSGSPIIEDNKDLEQINFNKSEYSTRPTPRKGWTMERIQKELKGESSGIASYREISKFDNIDDLMENIFYHGSISAHDRLKAGSTLREEQRTGGYGEAYHTISLSGSKNIASNFASMGSSGAVMPVVLKKNANTIVMPNIEDSIELEDILPELWNKNVDAVKIGDWDVENKGYGEQELVILNPNAIMTMPGTTYFQNYHKPKFENMTKEEVAEILMNMGRRSDEQAKWKAEDFINKRAEGNSYYANMSDEEFNNLVDKFKNQNITQKYEDFIKNGKPIPKYSLSVQEANTGKDSNGKELSEGQKEYFKDSKATDENGNLIPVYHTTTDEIPQFNEFNPVGTPYYRFGDQVVNYYTDSKEMSGSYASQKYEMADTKRLNNMQDVREYIHNIGIATNNRFNIREENGKYQLLEEKTTAKEAKGFVNSLTENEMQEMRDNIYVDNEMAGTPYEREFEWDKFNKKLQTKYRNALDKYMGTADLVDLQQEIMRYIENPSLMIQDDSLNGNVIGEYNTQNELFRKLKEDISKSNWSKNTKIQYKGYANITNPYIIDAEARNWNQVVSQSNDFIDELDERVPQNTKNELTRLYQESANKSGDLRAEYELMNKYIDEIDSYLETNDNVNKMKHFANRVGRDTIDAILSGTGRTPGGLGVSAYYSIADVLEQDGVIGEDTARLIVEDFIIPEQVEEWIKNNYNKKLKVKNLYPQTNIISKRFSKDKISLKELYEAKNKAYNDFDKYRMPSDYFLEQISKENSNYLGYELEDMFETRAEIYGAEQVGEEIAQAASVGFSKPEMIRLWGTSKTTNDVVKEIIASNKDGSTDYDGIIIKNVVDYGGKSGKDGYKPHDLYITFNSNQFKAIDNENPTEDADIRYQLSQQNPNLPIGQFRGKNVRRDTNIPTIQENALNVPLNRQKRVLNPTEISNLNPEDANTTPILPTTRTLTGDKQSRFLNNLNQTEMLTQESKDLINNADIGQYRSVTNEESLRDASQKLSKGGKAETERWFRNDPKNVNATDIAEGFILLNQYQELAKNATNDADKYQANQSMVEVAKKLRQIGTEAGQTLQAYSILSRMTPEGMVYYAQSELEDAYNQMVKNKSRQWIEQHREDFELKPEETQFILDTMNEVANMEDGYDKKVKLAEIQKLMTDKLPPEKGKAMKSWMRVAMLFNPKTQVRNVAGNALIMPVNSFGDLFASYADKLVSRKTGIRTTGTTNIKAKLEGFRKGAYEATNDYRKGINTRDMEGNRFEIGEGKSFNDKTMIGKALNNVEGLLNYVMDAGDRIFSEAAFENSLQNQMKLNNTTEVTQDMIDIARQEALSRTWNDNNNYTKFVLNVRSMLNKINFGAYGLGDVLIPFAKTPANLTKAIVDYSPVGFVNTLLKGNKLSRSLENGQYTPQLQHDFVQTLGKATAGTMLYVLGMALAKAGITSGESDDDKDTQNFLKNTLGISNYSIKIGNKSFTYDWAQPIAAPLSITANIEGRKDKEQALGEAILSNLDTASSVLLEQSFMQGINEVLNNNGKIVDGMINQVLGLPARAIPTLSKQIVDLTDSTQRTSFEYGKPVESAINAAKAKIPGLSQTLAPVVDTMGREVQRYGGKNNLFNVFLNPANVNTENISESAAEIYRVYKETGDKTIMPRVAPYYINQKNEKITLNSKQKAEFQRISGEIINDSMKELIDNQVYENLNDTEKASMIKNIVDYSYNKARKDVLNIDMSSTYNKVNEFVNDGGTPAEYYTNKEEIDYAYANPSKYQTIRQIAPYYTYKNYDTSIKAVKNNYSTTNERKNAVINYVNGLELGIPQKAMLIRMNYSSFKQYDNLIIDYINSQDLTVEQKSDILKEIGFTIKNGVVYN